ncbi:hypothetical protein CP083_06035 [Candidatus Bathyarchaeota archaeon B24-2]|nr:MAG: hypothetical protein CP083_06035 [Candidatus Bathyarchaeota archaeon B24-2]
MAQNPIRITFIVYKIYFIILVCALSKTIQVRESVYRLLVRLKKQMKARSFNEVIQKLALKESGLPEEMFGIDREKIKPFTERDRMEDRW